MSVVVHVFSVSAINLGSALDCLVNLGLELGGAEAFGSDAGAGAAEGAVDAVGAADAGAGAADGAVDAVGAADGTADAVGAEGAGADSGSGSGEIGLPISARVSVSFVVTLSKTSRFWSAFGSYSCATRIKLSQAKNFN